MSAMILIYDDDQDMVKRWITKLGRVAGVKDVFKIEGLSGDEFRGEVAELEARRAALRPGANRRRANKAMMLDKADIFIVDYDLVDTYESMSITGETMAYLARCYSTCGVIVGLNQFGNNLFDLRLASYPESFADVNIGSDDIDNPGLWQNSWSGYRPWSWPLLPSLVAQFRERVREVKTSIKEPIVRALGIPANVLAMLPTAAREFLSRDTDYNTVTFEQFVLNSGNGLRSRDEARDNAAISRIAAARVGRFVEDFLQRDQHILVDAPHLVQRFPSLLTGRGNNVSSWNALASFDSVSKIGLHYRKIYNCRFKASAWVSRPAWYWNLVSELETINEVADPWSAESPQYLFCENISAFLKSDEVLPFEAHSQSPFARRYVANRVKVRNKNLAASLKRVDFVNRSRLAL